MTTQAEKIANYYNTQSRVLGLQMAKEQAVDTDDGWGRLSTIYTFADCSRVDYRETDLKMVSDSNPDWKD